MASKEIATTNWYTDASLKAYYRFSTGALTTDSSGEGHTLTAVSDPAEVDGVFGKAADFDANDAYSATDHADFKPTGAFSVGCWIKTSNNAAAVTPFFQSYSANTNRAGFVFYLYSGELTAFSAKNTGTTVNVDYKTITKAGTSLADNVWHFVVLTYDNTNLRIYIDGIIGNTVAWAYAPAYAATNYVRIGCYNTNGTDKQFFTGSVDDLFLINGSALTSDEIAGIYWGFKSFNGLGLSSVKSINGLAKASVKSLN